MSMKPLPKQQLGPQVQGQNGGYKTRRWALALTIAATVTGSSASAAPQTLAAPFTIAGAVEKLKPGEFIWAPEVAPQGPLMVVVSLQRQRAYAYRNGVMIGVSTASTGVKDHETPTGVFTVLQKHVDHKSNLYEDAPMPFMQRLTWDGIAMHAGRVTGFPASHGCIRLPFKFAKLLYGITSRGMTVVITDDAPAPRVAPTLEILVPSRKSPADRAGDGGAVWQPELSPTGPLSIVVSTADRRMVVLRNGIQIGAAPVKLKQVAGRPVAYVIQEISSSGPKWLALVLPWNQSGVEARDPTKPGDSISVDEAFRRGLIQVFHAGTTVVITPDSLEAGNVGAPMTIMADGG